jgi:hypothetical protein
MLQTCCFFPFASESEELSQVPIDLKEDYAIQDARFSCAHNESAVPKPSALNAVINVQQNSAFNSIASGNLWPRNFLRMAAMLPAQWPSVIEVPFMLCRLHLSS